MTWTPKQYTTEFPLCDRKKGIGQLTPLQKANENPREEGKTPAPTKQKNNPLTPVTAVPPAPGPFPFVPGDKAFQVLSPTNDDPTPPICSGPSNDMPTQQFNNVAEANQATFVLDNALQSANTGWTYKDAPKYPPLLPP